MDRRIDSGILIGMPDAAADRTSLTVVILAQDEALHIARCIASVAAIAERIIVVDSGSTDNTLAIATAAGAETFHHAWKNHASQFNWALDHCAIASDWTMRLDADEIVSPALGALIAGLIGNAAADGPAGATVDRSIHFMGGKIRWGGMYPVRMLRLWRTGRGRIEARWMDEHAIVDGAIAHLPGELADINLNSIGWWTAKHNGYATREAVEALQQQAKPAADTGMDSQARRKRWLKHNVYARLPLGLRPLLYFLYRYVLLLGFLDGRRGLMFHGLQGLWYRFLVDVKIAEIAGLMQARGQTLAAVVDAQYGLKLDDPDDTLQEKSASVSGSAFSSVGGA